MSDNKDEVAGSTQQVLNDVIANVGGNTYQLDGPLARAYSEALDDMYKKERDPSTGIVLESQALDVISAQQNYVAAKASIIDFAGKEEDMGLLYGVQRGHVNSEHVIEVVDAIGGLTEEQKAKSAIIIDSALTNENTGEVPTIGQDVVSPFEAAMEAYCQKHGVSVYRSLGQFVKLNM